MKKLKIVYITNASLVGRNIILKILLKIKKYSINNQDRGKKCSLDNRNRTKNCHSENCDRSIARKKIFSIKRYKTDVNFRFFLKTRSRIRKGLNGMSKSFSTTGKLGIDINTNKILLKFRVTPDMIWGNIDIGQVKPFSLFDISFFV